jgi:TolB-like protein
MIGALLRVRYCLSGTVEVTDRNITVAVELADTRDGGIVWGDRFSGRIDDVHAMRVRVLGALAQLGF